jgi:hypothetical protein
MSHVWGVICNVGFAKTPDHDECRKDIPEVHDDWLLDSMSNRHLSD